MSSKMVFNTSLLSFLLFINLMLFLIKFLSMFKFILSLFSLSHLSWPKLIYPSSIIVASEDCGRLSNAPPNIHFLMP